MKKRNRSLFLTLALIALVAGSCSVHAAEPISTATGQPIDMIAFGNSYSGWASHVPLIAQANGQTINILRLRNDRPFGSPPKPGEKAPELDLNTLSSGVPNEYYAANSPALGEKVGPARDNDHVQISIAKLLDFKPWQVVGVQTHSSRANYWDTASWLVSHMQATLKTRVPTARLYYYFTTQYSDVEHLFRNLANASSQEGHIREGYPYTEDQHYFDALQVALRVEREYGVIIVPGGTALENARYDSRWGFNDMDPDFDYFSAKKPAQPAQSDHFMHLGFVWRAKKDGHYAWSFDSHPNVRLNYLTACVWYELLTGKSPVGSTYVPEEVLGRGLTAEQCRALQEIAHDTTLGVLPPLRLSHPESRQQYADILWQRAEAMRASGVPEKQEAALKNLQHLVAYFPEHTKVAESKALLEKSGKLEATMALAAKETAERPIRERRFKDIWDRATKMGVDFKDDKDLGRPKDL